MQQDIELMQGLANNDPAAFATFKNRFGGLIRQQASHYKTDPDDLYQIVQIKIWKSAQKGSFDGKKGLLITWVLRIVAHSGIDALRKHQRNQHISTSLNHEAREDMQSQVKRPDDGIQSYIMGLRRILANPDQFGLREEDMTMLKLVALGYNQSNIAASLGRPVGTVKSGKHRGMLTLKLRLQELGRNA